MTKLASRTKTSQDDRAPIPSALSTKQEAANTYPAGSHRRTVTWRTTSASDHHKINGVPCMTVAPKTRLADTNSETFLWTMRGWMRRTLSSRSTSAGKCLEKKRQPPQALPQYFVSYAATTLMQPWRENAVTVMKRLSAQREKRMKNCRLS